MYYNKQTCYITGTLYYNTVKIAEVATPIKQSPFVCVWWWWCPTCCPTAVTGTFWLWIPRVTQDGREYRAIDNQKKDFDKPALEITEELNKKEDEDYEEE